ncbi:hypothetical protein WEI85_45420 [Actinomycetes bacterium KLBMP 9797]
MFAADKPSFTETLGTEEREAVRRFLDRRGTIATAPDRHQTLYTNYLGRIDPADRDLILPAPIDRLALVGTRNDLLPRIAAMEAAGIDEIVISSGVDPPAEMAEFAKLTA